MRSRRGWLERRRDEREASLRLFLGLGLQEFERVGWVQPEVDVTPALPWVDGRPPVTAKRADGHCPCQGRIDFARLRSKAAMQSEQRRPQRRALGHRARGRRVEASSSGGA